mmetsp:Transcript_7075/g.20821  ORF Transcript_7075/g.20821 Transcript_7075/m.20821 type:complete len:315 (+) Transcript_7075:2-946(+)
MADDKEPDELYTLRNFFYLGAFQKAIQEGNSLSSRLTDELKIERDEFVYRAYVGLGQYSLVTGEVEDDAPASHRAVKLLASYCSGDAEGAVAAAHGLLTEKDSRDDATAQLMAAIIYEREDLMKEAFTAIRKGQTMEQLAFWAQLCLKINRQDLAEEKLKELEKMDEDATLTQLVSAWVNLGKQTEKGSKEAAFCYEELIDKFEATLSLLNGLASAKMQLKDYDEAHARLQEALGKSATDPDTLINLITCCAHMGKEEKEINRYKNLMYSTHPTHPYVVKMKAAEAEFDRLAEEMLEKEGFTRDAEGNVVKKDA